MANAEGGNRGGVIAGAIAVAAVVIVIGYFVMGRERRVTTPDGAVAAPASAPAAVAAAEVDPTANVNPADLAWRPVKMDLAVEEADGLVHISGVTTRDNWHFNGMQSMYEYPEGDFTASVDFKVVKFEGTGNQTTYLRAESSSRDAIGVYFNPSYFYQMHSWGNPQVHSATHGILGDEAKVFHRLKLQYEQATQTATSSVDDKPIGTIKAPLRGTVHFQLVANTNVKGMDVDVYFKNFKVETAGK